MKATLLLSALFSTAAFAGVIQPRQDDQTTSADQSTSPNTAADGGGGGGSGGGGGGGGGENGGTFKFAPACQASGSATPNPQDPMAKALMAYHNVHRTYHGACSLLWDPALAKQAQAAADTCKFQHQMVGDNGQNVAEQSTSGNIAAGTVSMWYDEGSKTNYQGGNMQQGHYTQVLWKGTFALGCGVKNCGEMALVFCDYAPAGNMMGAFEQNIGNRVAGARPVCAEQQTMSQYSNGGSGNGGTQGKCITDQELGLPAGAGGGSGGGGGSGVSSGSGSGSGNGGGQGSGGQGGGLLGMGSSVKKGHGGMKSGGSGLGSLAQFLQGAGGGGMFGGGG